MSKSNFSNYLRVVKINLCVLTLVVLMPSCLNHSVQATEYISYLTDKENGLKQVRNQSAWEVEVQYKTPELMALQELSGKSEKDESRYKALLEQFGSMQYFVVHIKLLQESDSIKNILSDRAEYFNFSMQQDFSLVMDGDTLPCSLYFFENTFAISGYCSISLAFNADADTKKNRTLLFNGQSFGLNTLPFEFQYNDIKKIPSLLY